MSTVTELSIFVEVSLEDAKKAYQRYRATVNDVYTYDEVTEFISTLMAEASDSQRLLEFLEENGVSDYNVDANEFLDYLLADII